MRTNDWTFRLDLSEMEVGHLSLLYYGLGVEDVNRKRIRENGAVWRLVQKLDGNSKWAKR